MWANVAGQWGWKGSLKTLGPPDSGGPLLAAFLMWDLDKVPAKLRPVTEDHIRMQQILKESGLDCVYVMPPHIAGAAQGGSIATAVHGCRCRWLWRQDSNL